MKKQLLSFLILLTIIFNTTLNALPPGEGDDTNTFRGYGYFYLKYTDGSPVANQRVELYMNLDFYPTSSMVSVSKTVIAYTNSSGYAYLIAPITVPDWYGFPSNHYLQSKSVAQVTDCQGLNGSQYVSTTSSYVMSTNYEYSTGDCDEDGIEDSFEAQLAEQFKPVIHKHSWDKQQELSNFEESFEIFNGIDLYGTKINGSQLVSKNLNNSTVSRQSNSDKIA